MNLLCIVLGSVLALPGYTFGKTDVDVKLNNGKFINKLERFSLFNKISSEDSKMNKAKAEMPGKVNENDVHDFVDDNIVEGREKKEDMMTPLVMGGLGSGAITIVLAGIKMFILKALVVAKIALLLSILLVVGKLTDKSHGYSPQVEVEHYGASEIYPVYTQYSHPDAAGIGYSEHVDGGQYTDIYNSYPGGAAESIINYAAVAMPGGLNGSIPVVEPPQHVPMSRRYYSKRKAKVPMILTIRQYTKPS